MIDIKNNSGGTVGNKTDSFKLGIKERIIYDNLNQEISTVLVKSNLEFKKNNIQEITLNELIDNLHILWRRGIIDFSYL